MPLPPTGHLAIHKRVDELELRLRQIEWKADRACAAEEERVRQRTAFWWDLYRLAAILSVVVPLTVLLYRRWAS